MLCRMFVAPKEAACINIGGAVKLSVDQVVQCDFRSHFDIKLQFYFHLCRHHIMQRQTFLQAKLLPLMPSDCTMSKAIPFELIKYLQPLQKSRNTVTHFQL